ncbi:cbb3-type cytochrome c oxidase subunit 3 [Planktotalea sp.]|uniref:cbb3-type cytochrome c oxidase subunit 3 n=1 Tax=Planktotalea sp. TaxID=2029877 RepID=UPI003F6B3AF2
MDTYSLLREIADSWVLLAMFCFFVGVGIWAFLPSQNAARVDASMIPLRDGGDQKTCSGTCESCASSNSNFELKG